MKSYRAIKMSCADSEDEGQPMLEPKKAILSRLRSAITVEPIAFLYILPFVLSTSTNQQYASYYKALQLGGDPTLLTVGLCSIGVNNTDWVAVVQSQAADYLTIFSFLNNIPMVGAALLMGSYSDKRGRKIAMCAPVIGGIIRASFSLAVVYTQVNINYLYVAAILEGLFGGSAVITLALYAYIADVSTRDKRSWRMLLLMVAESCGIAFAEISAGYIITYIGFILPFAIILSCYTLCLLLIFFYVEETVAKEGRTGLFDVHHFTRTFGLLIKGSKPGMVGFLRLATLATWLVYACQSINAFGLYLYVAQYPLCFTWVQVGYLIATVVVLQTTCGPLFFRLLHGRLQDEGLMMVGALDGVLSQAYLAIPVMQTIYIFCQPAVAFLTPVVMPLSRALMSRAVGPDEQGATQAIVSVCNVVGTCISVMLHSLVISGATQAIASVCNVVGNMVGSVCASAVYSATAANFTGSVFVLGSGVYLAIFFSAAATRWFPQAN